MDNMGLLNKHNGSKELSVNLLLKRKKYNNRELLINKFIEKFPKVKLHTIVEINKYYNCHYDNTDNDKKEFVNEKEIINDYIMNY